MNMQVFQPTGNHGGFSRKGPVGYRGATASDEPFLAACAAGFIVAELLAMRPRSQYFCRHSER
jgi:hypothetical protein